MKIAIGIPHNGSIKPQTVLGLVGLMAETQYPLHVMLKGGCYVHENRSYLVRQAVEAGATHLFFLDADIVCPGDTIMRLLAHHKPIVGAMYNERGTLPPANTIKIADADGNLVSVKGDDLPKEVFPCYAIATGCMLIEMSVFHGTPQPWFGFDYFPDGTMKTGEDVWFCREAAKHGYATWCDPSIPVAHIGDFAF